MAVVTIITVQVWTGKAVNHLSPCSTGICAHAGGSVLWAWFILLTRDSVISTNAFTSGALLLPGFLAQAIFFSCKVRICALGLRCCNVRPYILSCQYLLQDLEIRAIIFLLLTLMTSGHFLNCLWSRTLHCLVSTCHRASKLCLLLCILFLILLASRDWRQFIVIPHCTWENAGLCLSPHVLFSLLCYFHQSLSERSYEVCIILHRSPVI